MSRRISRDYECQECGLVFTLLVPDDKDHWAPTPCKKCKGESLHKLHVHVSTAKLSNTIPDCVAKGRFDKAREKRSFQRAAEQAEDRGNNAEAAEARREGRKAGYDI